MYYSEKNTSYFSNARLEILRLIPDDKNARLLEVGASGGYTLKAAKQLGKCGYCAGIELFELPGTLQQSHDIDRFIIGNIESDEFDFENEHFDVIIFPDVLEHLVDPWGILKKSAVWLKPGGLCIISVPNFQYLKNAYQIFIKGNFAYTSHGILDKTHLRFFCKPNVETLANVSPLKMQKIYPGFILQRHKSFMMLNWLTLGLLKKYLAVQYITVSQKI